jgi:anti-sigma regulatory factor (Ser/Thr protein kinase)
VEEWYENSTRTRNKFAEWDAFPLTFICPYDARALPDDVIAHARGTHPEIVDAGSASRSEAFEDPDDYCRRLNDLVRADRGKPVAELSFGLSDLAGVRRLVEWEGSWAGLSAERADELVLAVTEIATNALVHGNEPATVRIWNESGEIVCEVRGAGPGIDDPLVGQLRPPVTATGGRRLWLTRMVADAVEVFHDGAENAVAIHAVVSSPAE